jgi:hypothetical protein
MANITTFYSVSVNGINGSGNISITGAKAGDVVLMVQDMTGGSINGPWTNTGFESVLSTDGQITQSSGANLSSHILNFVFLRMA